MATTKDANRPTLPSPLGAEPSATSTLGEPPHTGWQSAPRRWMPEPHTTDHPCRTLVLLFDGTGDQFDDDNSNIVQLMSLLKKDDTTQQMVYYQPGIGTYTDSGFFGMGMRKASKVLDEMVAWSLGLHVREGYEFLMQNYTAGDKICIFGFSRGAYTARALAGMLQKTGLLPACNFQQLPFAYLMYTREDDDALRLCRDFKFTYSIDVKIEFIGVWDTVASVGLVPKHLPFVGSNSSIRYFRHALALDEHRAKFLPSYYKHSHDHEDDEEEERARHAQEALDAALRDSTNAVTRDKSQDGVPKRPKGHGRTMHSEAWIYENEVNRATGQKTDALEVWFAGVHTDVGGGSVPNHTRHSLARIPLRWMIRECFATKTGLIFDMDMLRDVIGLDVDLERRVLLPPPSRVDPRAPTLAGDATIVPDDKVPGVFVAAAGTVASTLTAPVRLVYRALRRAVSSKRRPADVVSTDPPLPRSGPGAAGPGEAFAGEALEELRDVLSPMYDQLRIARGWWVLEWVPLRVKKEKAVYEATDRFTDSTYLVNNGQGRKVFKHVVGRGMTVHRSVLTRMEALSHDGKENTYVPRVQPNIVLEEDGAEQKHCKRMTHEEWVTGSVRGMKLKEPWFKWV